LHFYIKYKPGTVIDINHQEDFSMSKKSFTQKVYVLISIVAILTTLLASACTPAPASSADNKKTIALGMFFRRDEWWQDLEKTALDTAAKNNLELLVQDADADNAKQLQQMETFVSQNVEAIVYAPIDPEATAGIVADAHNKGIKIVCIELCLNDLTNVDAWVQFDQEKAGYELGVLAGEFLNEKYGGVGKVAVVWDPTNLVHQMRYEGWKKGLKDTAPNAEYVSEQNGENNRDKSMSIAENILTAHPDTVVWYTLVEEMAFGVIAALEAKGIDPETVAVYAEGWGQETLENIAGDKPYMKGAMITPSTILANAAVQAVADHLNDSQPFTKDMLLGTDIVTTENAVEYFESRGYTLP
jgi:ribose transport system substrate-binding protein